MLLLITGPAPVAALCWVFSKDDTTDQLTDRLETWHRENRTPMPLLCAVPKFQIPTPSGRYRNGSKFPSVSDFLMEPPI